MDRVVSRKEHDHQMRPILSEFNPLSNADGSVILAQGNTSVIVAIQGPVEVKLQNLKIDRAHVECSYRPISGMPTIRDKLREALISDTCESALLTTLHPRTMVSIQVQELDDFGGLEACAINGSCLALLISGIPMKFTIAAVHCILNKDDLFVLDPCQLQSVGLRASFTFVFDSLEKNIVTVHTRGSFSVDQLNEAEALCRSASAIIFQFYRKSLAEFCSKQLPTGRKQKQLSDNEYIPVPMEA